MDRRKFLTSAIPVTVIATTAGATGRLFGSPSSIKPKEELSSTANNDLLKYRLSNLNISPTHWGELVDLSNIWNKVCFHTDEADNFCKNKEQYLLENGLCIEQQYHISPELEALKVFVDKDVISSVKNGDSSAFFKLLTEKNLISGINNSSLLREKLDDKFTRSFRLLAKNNDINELEIKDSLFSLYNEIGLLNDRDIKLVPGNQVVAVAAAAIVVIAVSVVAYATVAVVAGAAVLAAVAISIGAYSAVVVGGGGGGHVKLLNEKSVISEMTLAAQVSDTIGNDELTQAIIRDIENTKAHISLQLDDVLDLAVKHNLINFKGVNESKVRASLHSLVNNQLLQIS